MEDKAFSCRLSNNEADYLNKYYDGKFSAYVHDSFKRDIELSVNNKKQNILKSFSPHFLFLGLGAIFIFFSISVNSLGGFLLTFLLGVFFVITGLANMFFELKEISDKDALYSKKL